MSLTQNDARYFSKTIKTARKKKQLTQEACALLMGYSLSYQKDLERGRCTPSLKTFYHICRVLDISADRCIFTEYGENAPVFCDLVNLFVKCDDTALVILKATAESLLAAGHIKTI